jgi:hypothetical protein
LLHLALQPELREIRGVLRAGSVKIVSDEPDSFRGQPQEDHMVRRMAAVVLALTLNPALARAQDAVLTVTVVSADVHSGPGIGTPIIGHVPQGTVLPVSRNLGSWAKVAWPNAPDGAGYVHVTMGRLGAPRADASAANTSPRASSAGVSAASASASAPAAIPLAPPTPVRERMAVSGGASGAPITHIVGVGALVASRNSFGATARTWRTDHLGIQLAVSRDAMTSDIAGGRLTSMRVEPGVVGGLFDRVTGYVWIRPYVGSAMSWRRQTLKASGPVVLERTPETGVGFRVFGGSELTFANVPRLALSAELGYSRFPTAFAQFEGDRMSVAIAGHWYVK